MDINRLINDSIQSVITEGIGSTIKNKWNEVQDDLSRGRAGESIYDKLHPEKLDKTYEMTKKFAKANREATDAKSMANRLAKLNRENSEELSSKKEDLNKLVTSHLQQTGELGDLEARNEELENMSAGEHVKKLAGKGAEFMGDNPMTSAAVAAALAAGIGGLALRKRLKSAAK
jgi:hypothetical protein